MIPKRPGPLGVGVIIVLVLSWMDNVLSPAVKRCKITYQHLWPYGVRSTPGKAYGLYYKNRVDGRKRDGSIRSQNELLSPFLFRYGMWDQALARRSQLKLHLRDQGKNSS